MPFVRMLHGKGTGALRQAIREQLAHHALVRSYAPAEAKEGGEGITVVTCANLARLLHEDTFRPGATCLSLSPRGEGAGE